MKKLFALLLCLTLCAGLFAAGAPAFAEEAERKTFISGSFEYALLDDGTAEVTKYKGYAEALTIPDALDGHAVTSIGANPFSSCDKLTEIKVSPDHPTLAVIDGVLFSKTDKRLVCYPCALTATSYSIPLGIKVIGEEAFADRGSLTLTVGRDSYAKEYCMKRRLDYTYADANDWLNS